MSRGTIWGGCLASSLLAAGFAPRRAASSVQHEFSFQELKQLLQDHAITSVDQLMTTGAPWLPEALRSRYVLVHTSGSLQGATYAAPRIVLYSDDGTFIMAMAGDPAAVGHESLEVIEYNEATQEFDFARVTFPSGGADRVVFEDGVANPRPGVCAGCHGSPGRPNWATYNLWPSAYGAVDDAIAPETAEGRQFASFLSLQRGHGRYQGLIGLPQQAGEGFDVYKDYFLLSTNAEIYSHINTNEWAGTVDRSADYHTFPRANYKLTGEVSRLNVRRVASRLLRGPRFSKARDGLAAAFRDCVDPGAFVKDQDKVPLAKTLNEYVAEVGSAFASYGNATSEQTLAMLGFAADACVHPPAGSLPAPSNLALARACSVNLGYPRDAEIVGKLAYVLALVGAPIDWVDVSTTHGVPGYSFTFGNSGIDWLRQALASLGGLADDPLWGQGAWPDTQAQRCLHPRG